MNCVSIEAMESTKKAAKIRQSNVSPTWKNKFRIIRTPLEETPGGSAAQEFISIIEPVRLKQEFPMTDAAFKTVSSARNTIEKILHKKDKRLLVITGPCSIHDEKSALEYAEKLCEIKNQLKDNLFIVMRVYFEKPRTHLGWKGMISDPYMNGTFDMNEGLRRARRILLKINEMGIPTATEMLEPSTPAYIADLISWSAIGARTTESQTHREMASGLPMSAGFKNGTDGNLSTAINAILAAGSPQHFPGIDQNGRANIVCTPGNPLAHIVLRGGKRPNYDSVSVEDARTALAAKGIMDSIIIDCSHGNSGKDFRRQGNVLKEVIRQRVIGNDSLVGVMLESHLKEGSQSFSDDLSKLEYGVSVTDACIGWEETRELLVYADNSMD